MQTITFIGGGNMARSLIGGLIAGNTDPDCIRVVEPRSEAREALHRDFGVQVFADGQQAAEGAGVIVLAVKPQVLAEVCRSLAGTVRTQQPLLVSIAAGIRSDQIARWLGTQAAIVRCMPNTPALIGAGASGLYANPQVTQEQKRQAEQLLQAAGITTWVDEEAQIDTVTGIAGSAPAYFFLLVEALEDAAVARGLPRHSARTLAAQTCLGAGRMLVESGESPQTLRQRVTSPNGTTQAALESFERDDLRGIVARAVKACAERGAALADEND